MDESWWDPTAAWWAKAARALKHVRDVGSAATAFESAEPYEIRAEASDTRGEVVYQFRMLKQVPTELLTIIGDAIHNMRSCLDSMAFELARRHLGGTMTEEQETAAQFPIKKDGAAFDKFFDGHGLRKGMYGQRERNAIRCVQPFAFREEFAAMGVDLATTPELEFQINELARLNVLSNIDKHRRLPLLAWYLELAYFPCDVPEGIGWHNLPPNYLLEDDCIIAKMRNVPRGISPPEPVFELKLVLGDDPAFAGDLVGTLERWQSYLTDWILPRIFAVADGHAPPIMIARR